MLLEKYVNTLRKTFIGLFLVVFSTAVFAETAKVAVVDIQRALLNTERAQMRLKEMETNKNYVDARNDMRRIEESVRTMQAEMQKEGATWSAEKKQEQMNQLQYKQADWELAKKKVMAENQLVQKKIAEDMDSLVEEVLIQIVEDENIGLLLDSRAVIHATVDFDITDKVTQKINAIK